MVHKVRFKFILDYIVNLHCDIRNIILALKLLFVTLWSTVTVGFLGSSHIINPSSGIRTYQTLC